MAGIGQQSFRTVFAHFAKRWYNMGKYSGKTCRLLTMLSMTASFFLVEIIVGYITNSIALVADSFHMLSDVVALIVGFASVRISKWRTQKNTFGWARAEVLGALVNSVFLIALCFSILVEALKRFVEVEEINNPKLMLIVGAAGLLVNILGLILFHNHGHSHGGGGHGHSHGGGKSHSHNGALPDHNHKDHNIKESEALVKPDNPASTTIVCVEKSESEPDDTVIEFDNERTTSSAQLNMRAVFLHVLGDALGSVVVIISALMVWFIDNDWVYYVDPGMSVVLVCIILSTTIPLLKEASFILLQTVPTHIGIKEMKERLEQIDGISAVHELHIWQLTGNKVIASLHVICKNSQDYTVLANKVTDLFHNEGVHSCTIQPEFVDDATNFSSSDCVFGCGPNRRCYPDTCCAMPQKSSPNKGETTPNKSASNTSEEEQNKSVSGRSSPQPPAVV